MIDNILIIDTETNGLNPEKDKIIEVAAVLFNIKHKAILQCYSTLFLCQDNPVEQINHIPAVVTQCSYSTISCDDTLMGMADYASALVAHNAQFDKRFIDQLACGKYLLMKKWICTKANFTWSVPLQRLRLMDICEAMGVQYIKAHRALADCLLLVECLTKVSDLEDRIGRCL